jgi:hypothetical protein
MVWPETLPSGAVFTLKKPDVSSLGSLLNLIPLTFDPNEALGLVAQRVTAKLQQEGDASELVQFTNTLVKNCVLEPTITDRPLKECGEDELHISMIDPIDFGHIVDALLKSVKMGGTPEQKSFRKKSKAAPRTRRDGAPVQAAPEPADPAAD